MARELFIDASAWVALAETNDNHHQEATEAFARARKTYQKFVTTNLVVAEAHVRIRHVLGHAASIRFLDGLGNSLKVVYVYSGEELEKQAKAILRKYKDQDFSFADAVSFTVMQERRITDVFAYDRHFEVMGFRMVG